MERVIIDMDEVMILKIQEARDGFAGAIPVLFVAAGDVGIVLHVQGQLDFGRFRDAEDDALSGRQALLDFLKNEKVRLGDCGNDPVGVAFHDDDAVAQVVQ